MARPVVIDLFCGLGGWSKGFLAEGYDAYGFDIERHQYGEKQYPGQLILQDARTLHGRQIAGCAAIVASPPCQRYSWMAMPWKRSKREAVWQRWERDSVFGDRLADLNGLFNTCFRIQREASEAAGRPIPMVVENVKGAQPWVGRAAWHFGNYYLWGDVPALMPISRSMGVKISGQDWSRHAKTGETSPHWRMQGVKAVGHVNMRDGYGHTRHLTNQRESVGVKQAGLSGEAWFNQGAASVSSKSDSRKAASAQIAEIPFDLAQWIARVFKP